MEEQENKAFEDWDSQDHPFISEDYECQHKGEEYHNHKHYNGKEILPYDEQFGNYHKRMRKEAFKFGIRYAEEQLSSTAHKG